MAYRRALPPGNGSLALTRIRWEGARGNIAYVPSEEPPRDSGPVLGRGLSLWWQKQLVRLEPEDPRQLLDVIQRDVPRLPLYVRHEGPVQLRLKG